MLQNLQRTQIAQQIAVPRRQLPSLPSATKTPSNYATPQASLSGQDVKTTHIPVPVSPRKDIIRVDFDSPLDVSNFHNWKTLKFPKPSKVFNSNTIAETLDLIKTPKRANGQKLGMGPASKKLTVFQKTEIESQKATLKKYNDILENTEAGKKAASVTQIR